jgi:hypothetical protein
VWTIHDGAWITRPPEYPRGRGMNLQIDVSSVGAVRATTHRLSVPLFRAVAEPWYATLGEAKKGQLLVVLLDPDGPVLRLIESVGSRERQNDREHP